MAESLLQPPTNALPQTALTLSQQASSFVKSQSSWTLPYPLSLFFNSESQEKWHIYENILLACLRTGDNKSAYLYLEELTERFGRENNRIMGLRGLYQEATANTRQELENVLVQYQEILKEDPTASTVRKRRAALLRSMGKTTEAITALTNLLDTSPTDAEAWVELGDLYLTHGLFEQAIFCLEEVLLITPNAWNLHARLAEVTFLSASRLEAGPEQARVLSESMRRFCRSVELCDGYLRGYYGLKLVTNKLLEISTTNRKALNMTTDATNGDLAQPSITAITRLNEVATAKLAEIVRRGSAGEKGWDGYSPGELIAARELLDRDVQKIQR